MNSTNPHISVKPFSGEAALPFLSSLAKLRIEVFREFPYLYDGHLAYEQKYLQTLAEAPGAVLVIAFDGEEVVGASTGLPLAAEPENIQAPFNREGIDINRVFYFGESVLKKEYRGRGIGVEFFHQREKWATTSGHFEWTTFCAVVRPSDHPLRPVGYLPLDGFWQKRGYIPAPGMTCYISWKDLNEAEETEKPLQFWWKKW